LTLGNPEQGEEPRGELGRGKMRKVERVGGKTGRGGEKKGKKRKRIGRQTSSQWKE